MAAERESGESRVTSATQLRGLSWGNLRDVARDLVETFCRRYHLDPGQFMSNLGFLRSERWRQGVDWKECVNWNKFNELIFNAIPGERARELDADTGVMTGGVVGRRFDRDRFLAQLQSLRESASQRAGAGEAQRTARRPAAAPAPPEQAAAPAETPAAAPTRRPRSFMSDAVWSRVYSETEAILDRFPALTEEQREAIHAIMDRAGTQTERRLVSVNLTEYLRYLSSDLHVINDRQATELYDAFFSTNARSPGLVLRAEAWVREERETRPMPEPTRLAQTPRRREAPAPRREERYVYRLTVSDPRRAGPGNPDGLISTFEITSPTPIQNTTALLELLHERPEGLAIFKTGAGGRRVAVQGDQIDLFENRMNRLIRFDAHREVTVTELRRGRPGA